MARIIQGTSSAGFGGLEMVIQDFHAWLIENGHDASVVVLEGTALHRSLLAAGFQSSTIAYPAEMKSSALRKFLHEKLDSPNAAFLFHRHAVLRLLIFKRFKAKTSMLSHTFYKSKKRDFWHRFLFSRIDRWVALTPLHRQNMIEMLGVPLEKISIIPNGVNLSKFHPAPNFLDKKDEFHIGIVARLDPQKGQDLAIEALAQLKLKTKKRIYLHLFGEDTPGEPSIRPRLEALIEKLKLEENVIFEGFRAKVYEVLPQMDFLWLSSHRETFGRCVVEAMACGVPVIGSNAGGVPDIIQQRDNGMLFESMNAEDLMLQTLALIEDSQLRKNIRERALSDVVQQYDMDQIFARLLQTILPSHVETQRKTADVPRKVEIEKAPLLKSEASFELAP